LGKLTATNAQSDSDEVKNAMKKLDEYVKTINESDWKADKVYDVVRQEFVKNAGNNSASATSASDFVADLTEAIQGNDTAKDDVGMSEAVNYAVNFLDNSNAIQKGLDAGLKEWKHNIDTTVKTLTTQQKTWIKNNRNDVTLSTRAVNYKHSALSAAIQVMQTTKNIGITAHTTAITCLKACSGQSKSICVQALNYKKPKNESTSLEGDYSSSLLESVELI
jgi:hypothetical protein